MQTYIRISVCILCAVLIAGCGKKEDKKSTETPQNQSKDTQKISSKPSNSTAPETIQQLQSSPEPEAKKMESMGAAPDFTLTALDGTPVSLSSLSGKVVLIDFWATWCPPCRKMIPALKDLHSKYNRQGLEVIGISLDESGPETVKAFVESMKMPYLVAIGDNTLSDSYGKINAIPTSFIIDRKGDIRQKHVGFVEFQELEQSIKILLSEKN
ncbi:TlpA family protein disulfide reductase [bacterium]|nr:TlpA family protein disulfide reductase [bacterium]